jgi:hypothetical protein
MLLNVTGMHGVMFACTHYVVAQASAAAAAAAQQCSAANAYPGVYAAAVGQLRVI